MEIWNCEYCNAYLTNFEVHNCANFRAPTTLPQCSSGNRTQDIDVRTQQMHYEERMPSMNQAYSSRQHSIHPNMHQRTDCEEAAAAEMPSQYLIANQNTFNPVTSEFQFPDMAREKENQFKSPHFQQPFEAKTLFLNQNPRCGEASSSKYPANAPLPVAEPWICLDFNTRLVKEMQWILANQNAQYNRWTRFLQLVESIPVYAQNHFLPNDDLEPQVRSRSVTKPTLQEHVRIIHNGQNSYICTQCDKCFAHSSSLRRHVRSIHTGDRPYRCPECGQCFAHSSTLRRHVRNIHADDGS
ncbi:hypothetical protein CEXT_322681 [Caerostris extrusa]|uniref:C2H2-type domain-containing protein n=1 Tax=Caerostris extrusa TaxID=172846 RepID=A0AAV4VTW8_CAEEX|nr:hypothetical protein CEXT_322681 [Caerostris extrusa]